MAVLPLYSREPPAVDALLARAASLIDSKIASLDADLRQISHTISGLSSPLLVPSVAGQR